VKTSRPQPQASAALLEDLLMAGYRGATRLGAQLHNLPHGTVWWPASGVPACGLPDLGRTGCRASLHVPSRHPEVIML
jgi:hypothetical protein